MRYFYSASKNAFFPAELYKDYEAAGTWPKDAKEVSYEDFVKFSLETPPKGKLRTAGNDGMPAWSDIPPATAEEVLRQAEVKQDFLMSESSMKINPLQDAVDLEIATEEEIKLLVDWKKYRVLLNRISTQPEYPTKIDWPVKPE